MISVFLYSIQDFNSGDRFLICTVGSTVPSVGDTVLLNADGISVGRAEVVEVLSGMVRVDTKAFR